MSAATISTVQDQLLESGYSVDVTNINNQTALLFENDLILGFVICFPDADTLIRDWKPTSQVVLQGAQLALRRAERKAWNAYLVLLADAPGEYGEEIMLGAIEEDLIGTRKIARSGVGTEDDIRAALLPLLAIQNATQIEAVDMLAEIRLRTSELPNEIVEAFLKGVPTNTLTQLLEDDR